MITRSKSRQLSPSPTMEKKKQHQSLQRRRKREDKKSSTNKQLVTIQPKERKVTPEIKQKKANNAPVRKDNEHRIIVTEPLTFSPYAFVIQSESILVNDEMHKEILKGPTRTIHDRNANAYIFGRLYEAKDYKKIGEFGNDMANCGIIDVDLSYDMSRKHVAKLKSFSSHVLKSMRDPYIDAAIDKITEMYSESDYNFEDRKILKEAQKSYPWLMFMGETTGGDVGGLILAHYDQDKNIDSLVIDNVVFVTADELDTL